MSACALRRWGTGTPCVKESGVEKEMALKLAAMRAEREKQDGMWLNVQTKSEKDIDVSKERVHESGTRN
jgi:hypothetical protein